MAGPAGRQTMSEPKLIRDILREMVDDPDSEVGSTLRQVAGIDEMLANPGNSLEEKSK